MAHAADDPSRLQPHAQWRHRLSSSAIPILSTALAHAPENAAYGLMAMAPLGPTYATAAMALALVGTIVSNVVGSVGGAGRLVAGPRISLALLTAGLVSALSARLADHGSAASGEILALVAIGVGCAGALQVGFGLLRLGNLVKYTPYPVRVGVTSGVGLLVIITAIPVIAGHGFGTGLEAAVSRPQAGAVLVGLVALAITAWAARVHTRIPPVLLGLGTASLLRTALAHWSSASGLGALFGTPMLPPDWFTQLGHLVPLHADLLDVGVLTLVGSYSLTVAVLCSLDTLLAVSIVDGRLRGSRDANRELTAQGLGNIAAGLVTGQAVSPSVPRSLALVVPTPQERHIVVVYVAALLALLLLAPELVGQVPISAIGGVLLLQGVQMVAPAFWRAPLELWRHRRSRRSHRDRDTGRQRVLGTDLAVELAVSLSAVALGLGPAILIGASLAVLLFVRANMRDVVRREWSGETRRSLKTRPASVAEALARQGRRIALLELEGSLFFGTADGLRARLDVLEESADIAILDLHQVMEIDITAARILFEAAAHWARTGKQLVFAEWSAGDPRRRLIEAMRTPSERAPLSFADNTDLALEQAEDRLLGGAAREDDAGRALTLADTLIGRGLNAGELALLAAELHTLRFSAGQVLFRIGDLGDGLYISLKGDIGLRIPGGTRRLASFAPGVIIGEMAMLARGTRSAEAVAETEVTALRLPIEAFDRLMREQPALAAKLLMNISLHLGDRVRVLTTDLSHWVTRAAAGRGVTPLDAGTLLRPESID